jgi:hypothetical protein
MLYTVVVFVELMVDMAMIDMKNTLPVENAVAVVARMLDTFVD